ncbi:MAG: hypothetical protein EOO60_11620 [Hymenobacter sp.]|nr:MAG: hypothetical protein EOO60_11620 [Hymenobacter sp.]
MSITDLLTEITHAFQDEPHPSEWNIVYSNASDDPEVIQIRESFKAYTWQNIPDDILQYEQGGYSFLSNQGLRYYLPAYLCYSIREYAEADSIPDGLVFIMTLPTEADIMLSALELTLGTVSLSPAYPTPAAARSEHDYLQIRLQNLNRQVHRFIDSWHQFSPAQGRAILHFLEYLRDEHGQDYFDNEPAVAIERYWFQFA